jgi:hypothetical protein
MVNLTIAGVTYPFPQTGDEEWGDDVTDWAIAVSSKLLQKSGGLFQLTAEVDFGTTYGVKTAYVKSRTANPATAGLVRMANNEAGMAWRNAANNADLALKVNASDLLEYNGDTVLLAGAALTASRAVVTDGSGSLVTSAVTATEVGYLAGVTSAIQTQLNAKAPSASPTFTGTITTPLAASRAVVTGASSELAASAVTATEVGYLAGVTSALQTQLNAKAPSASPTFTGTITTPLTASRAVVTGASSELAASAVTATEVGYLSGVTSAIQTQLDNVAVRRQGLLNTQFAVWQAEGAASGTSATRTITNGNSSYGPDCWYGKNGLGTNGVLTISRTAGANDGAKYGCSLQITTAPTASQANGCELYQTLPNLDSIRFYNQTASFSVLVKALGNVNQVGVQFYYKTTEAKVDTSIGSEQTVAVTTGGWATASISAQALGTSMTTSGVVGVRIRITQVSSGNAYDLNNGFIIELPMMNRGSTPATYQPAYPTQAEELRACQWLYRKSYAQDTPPGTASSGTFSMPCTLTDGTRVYTLNREFPSMRIAPTIRTWNNAGTLGAVSYRVPGATEHITSGNLIKTTEDSRFQIITASGALSASFPNNAGDAISAQFEYDLDARI